MDPALLKERELFKKKALTTPTVEKKKAESKPEPSKDEKKKSKPSVSSTSTPKLDINTYKTSTGSTQYRFGVLAKIVKHMKTRHQDGETYPLTLEEILDETNQLDVGNKVKQWLQTEALLNNVKIEATPEGKFLFKSQYKLKDRKSLLKLLKQQDLKGLGGVLMDDVQESLPHSEKALRILQNQNEIIFITRPMDKRKVLFYNDRTASLPIDEEFQKLWRSVAVDAMDDAKIEEYLDKQGMISSVFLVLFYLANPSFCDERGPRVKRIVGGIPAEEPPADDPTIFTNFAGRSARVQGILDYPHYVFRGIKFAYPPIGKNRFLRPREKLLDGLINATYYAPPCIQPRPGTNQVIGSEDCLALNVFTPELPTGTEGLPVVVWIHGGGFRYGSASQYGVRHLVGKRLVVVTIQYRLGSLGFISSGTKHLPGNVALWDMALAVQWVRNYIGFFGGNPYRINVMGHGTGASSVLMIALSNIAKGIPAGVIAMSGTAVSSWAVDNTPQHTAYNIARQNGCPTGDPLTMVKCLQTLPPDSIIRGDSQIEFTQISNRGFMAGLSGGLGSAPVTEGRDDGRSLPGIILEDAMDEMQAGKTKGIPLLTGICKDETKRAVKGPFKDDVLKKLNTIPNFLNMHLIQNLRKLIPLKIQINLKEIKAKFEENFQKGLESIENIIGQLVPPNFSNYVKLKTGKLHEALDKVADITNDALFNVPAFLTADTWSIHGAPTYLYSFDHFGKNKKGHTFLKGSPLVGNDTHFVELNDTVAHGDDLAYLFDAYDVEGNPLEHDNLTQDDVKVRELFTQMIADFARYGVPKVNNQPASPFNAKKNNFIKITSSPTFSNNFKFCEMALWCNIAERLKSTTCEFLKALDHSFKNMQNFVNGLKNANLSPEKILEHVNILKNLTGQGINIFNQTGLANLSPDKVFKEINEKIKNVSLGIHSLLPPHEHKGLDILKIFDKKDQRDPKQNGFNLIPNIFEKKDPNQNQNGFHLLPNIFEKKPEPKPEPVLTGGFLNLFDVRQDTRLIPEQAAPVPNVLPNVKIETQVNSNPPQVPNLLPNLKIETQVNSNSPQEVRNIGPNAVLFPPDL